jgi:hypothetical protein
MSNVTESLTPTATGPIASRLAARLGVTSLAVAGRPIERRLVAQGLPSSLLDAMVLVGSADLDAEALRLAS